MPGQELPKRNLRAEECGGEVTALEVAPRIQNVFGIHIRRLGVIVACARKRGRRIPAVRSGAVAIMQDLVSNVIGEIEF